MLSDAKKVTSDLKVRLFRHQIKELDEHDLLAAADVHGWSKKGNYTLAHEVCGCA